jgi:hypothetical protein
MAAADGNAVSAVAESVPASVAAVGATVALAVTLVVPLVPATAMAASFMALWLWLPRAGELTVKTIPLLHAPLARDAMTSSDR